MWIMLTEELHKIPNGARKDWKQWRKTWQDLCTKTKVKQNHIKKHMNKTGGSPPLSSSDQLSSTDQQILETFHATAIRGDDNIAEPEVTFEYQDVEYLGDYQQMPHSNTINMESLDADDNYNQTTTYNIQDLSTEDGTRTFANEENIEIANNDKEIYNSKRDRNVNTKSITNRTVTQNKNKSSKRTVASQRLENTIEYTSNLVRLTKEDKEIRKKYYKRKIKLIKRNLIIKERIASVLENITNIHPFSQC